VQLVGDGIGTVTEPRGGLGERERLGFLMRVVRGFAPGCDRNDALVLVLPGS
jgi:hypothetical protein